MVSLVGRFWGTLPVRLDPYAKRSWAVQVKTPAQSVSWRPARS